MGFLPQMTHWMDESWIGKWSWFMEVVIMANPDLT
jgi:hypothetical protein